MSLVLDEFYSNLQSVGVSAATGQGINDFLAALESAKREYYEIYKPEIEARKEAIKQKEEELRKQSMKQFEKDIESDGLIGDISQVQAEDKADRLKNPSESRQDTEEEDYKKLMEWISKVKEEDKQSSKNGN